MFGAIVHDLYRLHFKDERRERHFLASIAFLITFGAVRGITAMIRAGVGPFQNVVAGTTHIHHLVWGILDRKSTRLNSSHRSVSRMPSSA